VEEEKEELRRRLQELEEGEKNGLKHQLDTAIKVRVFTTYLGINLFIQLEFRNDFLGIRIWIMKRIRIQTQ